MKHGSLWALAVVAAVLGAGCGEPRGAGETAAAATVADRAVVAAPGLDIARARAEGRYLREAAEIETAYRNDREHCQRIGVPERTACLERARSDYQRKLQDAQTRRGQLAAGSGRRQRGRPITPLIAC